MSGFHNRAFYYKKSMNFPRNEREGDQGREWKWELKKERELVQMEEGENESKGGGGNESRGDRLNENKGQSRYESKEEIRYESKRER